MSARVRLLLSAGFLSALASAAGAQGWAEFVYPQTRVAVQFPAPPIVTAGSFMARSGAVPTTVYSAPLEGSAYTLTVADFSGHAGDMSASADQMLRDAKARGEVKVDVAECISGQPGRELSIATKGGGLSKISLFAVGASLDNEEASAGAIRFQQSLRFADKGLPALGVAPVCRGRAREESRD